MGDGRALELCYGDRRLLGFPFSAAEGTGGRDRSRFLARLKGIAEILCFHFSYYHPYAMPDLTDRVSGTVTKD